MEIEIAPYYTKLIQQELESGKFKTESEVIQAGLALLEKEETFFADLGKAILDGESSGFALPFNNEDFKQKMAMKYAK